MFINTGSSIKHVVKFLSNIYTTEIFLTLQNMNTYTKIIITFT